MFAFRSQKLKIPLSHKNEIEQKYFDLIFTNE